MHGLISFDPKSVQSTRLNPESLGLTYGSRLYPPPLPNFLCGFAQIPRVAAWTGVLTPNRPWPCHCIIHCQRPEMQFFCSVATSHRGARICCISLQRISASRASIKVRVLFLICCYLSCSMISSHVYTDNGGFSESHYCRNTEVLVILKIVLLLFSDTILVCMITDLYILDWINCA
jgi:hypothetical protein